MPTSGYYRLQQAKKVRNKKGGMAMRKEKDMHKMSEGMMMSDSEMKRMKKMPKTK